MHCLRPNKVGSLPYLVVELADSPHAQQSTPNSAFVWTDVLRRWETVCGELSSLLVCIRSTDGSVLGIVSDRYKVVQNEDAFRFTDELLGEGVTYETAGSLQYGRKVWMLARMPQRYIIAGDEIEPYLVIMNSHDGSSGVKVAMTPIRVVCQNTLNLALNSANRIWGSPPYRERPQPGAGGQRNPSPGRALYE